MHQSWRAPSESQVWDPTWTGEILISGEWRVGMGELTQPVCDLPVCSWVDAWTEGWTCVSRMRRWKQRESLRCYAAGFEGGGRGHESRQFLEAGKGKEADSPLEPPEECCQQLDLSPA